MTRKAKARADSDYAVSNLIYIKKMIERSRICSRLGATALVVAVAACSNPPPRVPTNVIGQVPMAPAGPRYIPSLSYRAPDLDTMPAPKCFYIPETQIDTGPHALFLETTDQQKQNVAEVVTAAFRHAIGQHQRTSDTADPGCATLQLYLSGITIMKPGQEYGTLSANVLNESDANMRNLQASVNGTITVAGKFVAQDGTLLSAFVSRVGTNAFDIPATASPREIARLAAARLAGDVAGAVDREVAVQKRNQGL